jgi:hypothetical protein
MRKTHNTTNNGSHKSGFASIYSSPVSIKWLQSSSRNEKKNRQTAVPCQLLLRYFSVINNKNKDIKLKI